MEEQYISIVLAKKKNSRAGLLLPTCIINTHLVQILIWFNFIMSRVTIKLDIPLYNVYIYKYCGVRWSVWDLCGFLTLITIHDDSDTSINHDKLSSPVASFFKYINHLNFLLHYIRYIIMQKQKKIFKRHRSFKLV